MVVGARRRLLAVEGRLDALEGRLARAGLVARARVETPAPGPESSPQAAAPPEPPAEPSRQPAEPSPAPPEPTPKRPAVPQVAATASSAPPARPPSPPPPPGRSFEERFGTQWVVWVGGLALALGGIFLVRYTIEQGLIGPGVRTFLGGLLAAALIAAGEWTRRNEIRTGFADIPTAHIPGILTAAGTTVAYATVYAAYALYGFLPPGAA